MTDLLTILQGDASEKLRELPDESVQCCVTSPPYWALRDYGTATWEGGDGDCDHKMPGQPRSERPQGLFHGGDDKFLVMPFKSSCGKCGATRIDSQLGLEETPEQYVAKMVEVFREVRRVLRNDGTLWLNLGDSYAGSGKGPAGNLGAAHDERNLWKTNGGSVSGNVPIGLKPKDLVGIPWRVAFALQQPYYSGRIRRVEDRIWLAAMLDAEGCLFIHRRKAGQHNGQGYFRQNDSFGPGVEIRNQLLIAAIMQRSRQPANHWDLS